jgi:holo-[acyl-carrier protein] synthase
MRLHTGVDIIEIDRIASALERWGERFLKRIYTDHEVSFSRGRIPQLAGRFAAKEAMMKALGTGRYGVSWREIGVGREHGQAPRIVLTGRALARSQLMDLGTISVSISHSRNYAVAVVVCSNYEYCYDSGNQGS